MKKITFILAALVCGICLHAQKPVVTQLGISGRAVLGQTDFTKAQALMKSGDGEFVWYGQLFYQQTASGSQGFKFIVNAASPGNWLGSTVWSLRALADNTEISDGNVYSAIYQNGANNSNDFKWRLKQGEDGFYKITVYTSDVENIQMRLDKTSGSFADLASLAVENATLTPAFDPSVTTYSCVLMQGTTTALPIAKTTYTTTITGTNAVDVSSGSGVSTIVVPSLDGLTSKTYTINYSVSTTGPVNYTNKIINNDFDYVASGIPFSTLGTNYPNYSDGTSSFNSSAWRPVKTGLATHLEFYGWNLSDWSFLFIGNEGVATNQSLGINAGVTSTHGTGAWINGDKACVMPDNFEFYQTIDKDDLPAGTYKVSCLLGVQTGKNTSQRIFANNYVQFFGHATEYDLNKMAGEIYSYAGYTPSGTGDAHEEMKVYVTISDNESLKLGIRSGNKDINGNVSVSTDNMSGWFKMDYFRLVKLDPADATNAKLSSITLSAGTLNFLPETTTYNVVLPKGTTTVTPTVVAQLQDVTIAGTEAVDVSSGSGTSTIAVTALDGTTSTTYTIHYTVESNSNMDAVEKIQASYTVINGKLTVKNVEAYEVYSISGVTIANVKANASGVSVDLLPGMYIVKTKNAGTFKVIVK